MFLTITWSGELALDAVVLPAVSILACIATGGGLVIAIRRMVSPNVSLPATLDWLDELSVERYRPMLRLLDDAELCCLCARKPKVAADFRRARYQIFRSHLRALTVDFHRVCTALKLLMIQASTDRPDLASTLFRSQVAFACGMVVVRARLLLYSWGIGTVDLSSLLKLLDGMQLQLRTILPAVMPSSA